MREILYHLDINMLYYIWVFKLNNNKSFLNPAKMLSFFLYQTRMHTFHICDFSSPVWYVICMTSKTFFRCKTCIDNFPILTRVWLYVEILCRKVCNNSFTSMTYITVDLLYDLYELLVTFNTNKWWIWSKWSSWHTWSNSSSWPELSTLS